MNIQAFIEFLKKRLDLNQPYTRHDFYDQINLAFHEYSREIWEKERNLEVIKDSND